MISQDIDQDLLQELLRETEVKEASSRNESTSMETCDKAEESTSSIGQERIGQSTTNTDDPRDNIGVIDEPIKDNWETLDFKDPAELVTFFHPSLNSSKDPLVDTFLYPWQIEILESFAAVKPTSKDPHKYSLCACNGSGKDMFVISSFALWFIVTKRRSLVVITTASGTQMTTQTENYIASLGKYINLFYMQVYGKPILKINRRSVKCLLSGSEIVMFTTDEEGRAEGYHPLEPKAEMAIIVNEAKTVAPEIFRALSRCTGFNYWLNVSTPGEPYGDFYYSFTNWPNSRRITYYDCPHQSPVEFEEDKVKYGIHSFLFRSKWLALFTSISGNCIISELSIEKLKIKIKLNLIRKVGKNWPLRFGIDLAAGGDETVISVWKGNSQIDMIPFHEEDTTKTRDKIIAAFNKWKIKKDHDHLFADDGGLGKPIIDMLVELGWNVKRVRNNSAPKTNPKYFKNRGAELYTKFGRFIELGMILPFDDPLQWSQISSRHFKNSVEAAITKIQLESKPAEIANGFKSPDRADAAILAFTDVSVDALQTLLDNATSEDDLTDTKSPNDIQHFIENLAYNYDINFNPRTGFKGANGDSNPLGSLGSIIKRQSKLYANTKFN